MAEPQQEHKSRVTVVGIASPRFEALSPEAQAALGSAQVIVGGSRHLDVFRSWPPASSGRAPELCEAGAQGDEVVQLVRQRAVDRRLEVCVLAAGDPGFFGIVRALLRVLDRRSLTVLPAPSAVSLAYARLGLPWDDAAVISAQGRPMADIVAAARTSPKVAVLTSASSPPEAVGRALLEAGVTLDLVAVCSHLGAPDEEVHELDLAGLASGRFDPRSVLVLVGPGGLPLVGWAPGPPAGERPAAWGMADETFDHHPGPAVRAEIRAIALAKLALPPNGVLWDVASGAIVGVEAAILRPTLTVLAVEPSPEDAARASANANRLGAGIHVVSGRLPEVLGGLPAPDRVFVAGWTAATVGAVLDRLQPVGVVVAAFTGLDHAAEAGERLGNLVQVAVADAGPSPDGSWQLSGRDPVFVAWGPPPGG